MPAFTLGGKGDGLSFAFNIHVAIEPVNILQLNTLFMMDDQSKSHVTSKKKSIFTDVVHMAGLSEPKSIARDSVLDLRTKSVAQQEQQPKSTSDLSSESKKSLGIGQTFSAFASPTFFQSDQQYSHVFPQPTSQTYDFMASTAASVFGAQSNHVPLCWASSYGPSFMPPLPFRSQFPMYAVNSAMDSHGIGVDQMNPAITTTSGSKISNGSVGGTSTATSKAKQAPRFQCPECNRVYSTFSGLSKHRQFHCAAQLKRQFGCKFCQKHYTSLGALKMHIRTHTLPCKCELCGKAFSRPWLLQGHVRTHTGEKPFRCLHCGRAFADRSNLRAHLQTHSDVKKYRCVCCQKTFSRMSLLTKHESNGCSGTMTNSNTA